MDEKWHQHDFIIIVIGSCIVVEKELLWLNCTRIWLYLRWLSYLVVHVSCPIAFMGVEIQWVANGHCNSKTKWQV
jgi:hypothetical protein